MSRSQGQEGQEGHKGQKRQKGLRSILGCWFLPPCLLAAITLCACTAQPQASGSTGDSNTSSSVPGPDTHAVTNRHVPVSQSLAQHIAALRLTLPPGFSVVEQPPFAVVGDEPEQAVREHAAQTVKWAVDKLKQDYFTKDPRETIDVWLFKDTASYRKYTRQLFHETPDTPFGYYSPEHHALIMNISTGGGTLVHEIVHPFLRANFPKCPAWFNEGLASLYEQSGTRDGHIVGFPNWRLTGLQKDIKENRVIPFKELTALSDDAFYGRATKTRYSEFYAPSRYLCFYLQEKGLLTTYYREFAANADRDPTGYETLKKILGNPDMAEFQKRWAGYVMTLRFP